MGTFGAPAKMGFGLPEALIATGDVCPESALGATFGSGVEVVVAGGADMVRGPTMPLTTQSQDECEGQGDEHHYSECVGDDERAMTGLRDPGVGRDLVQLQE